MVFDRCCSCRTHLKLTVTVTGLPFVHRLNSRRRCSAAKNTHTTYEVNTRKTCVCMSAHVCMFVRTYTHAWGVYANNRIKIINRQHDCDSHDTHTNTHTLDTQTPSSRVKRDRACAVGRSDTSGSLCKSVNVCHHTLMLYGGACTVYYLLHTHTHSHTRHFEQPNKVAHT